MSVGTKSYSSYGSTKEIVLLNKELNSVGLADNLHLYSKTFFLVICRRKTQRFLQNLDAHAMKVDGASTKSSTVYTQGYFLNLTQVRLILLLLDAVIILARCYQTFQFMQKVWFGSVARVYVERVQGSPRQDVHLATGTNATLRDQFRGARLDATDFLHPATCSNNGDQKSDGFLQSGNSVSLLPCVVPVELCMAWSIRQFL